MCSLPSVANILNVLKMCSREAARSLRRWERGRRGGKHTKTKCFLAELLTLRSVGVDLEEEARATTPACELTRTAMRHQVRPQNQ